MFYIIFLVIFSLLVFVYFILRRLKLYQDTEEVFRRRIAMQENKKQSRRENKDTYVINPQKSADPPQPQGKNNNCNKCRNDNRTKH